MKNFKSVQLDFIPVISQLWIGAWTVAWLHQLHWLFNVDWCDRIRKEAFLASFKLLSLQLPGEAD